MELWLFGCVVKSEPPPTLLVMADVVQDASQEFWRRPSPTELAATADSLPLTVPPAMAEACSVCAAEFMIGAKFCHACGFQRPVFSGQPLAAIDEDDIAGLWIKSVALAHAGKEFVASSWQRIPFPAWLRYLHFHEIKRAVGLPTGALIAFILGLGCVAGAVGVSFFYKASNLAEFQAIQMWRIEWLLAATASFVAGLLLKKPSEDE